MKPNKNSRKYLNPEKIPHKNGNIRIYLNTLGFLQLAAIHRTSRSCDKKSICKWLMILFCVDSLNKSEIIYLSQPAITCSKLTIEKLEQSMKYIQS